MFSSKHIYRTFPWASPYCQKMFYWPHLLYLSWGQWPKGKKTQNKYWSFYSDFFDFLPYLLCKWESHCILLMLFSPLSYVGTMTPHFCWLCAAFSVFVLALHHHLFRFSAAQNCAALTFLSLPILELWRLGTKTIYFLLCLLNMGLWNFWWIYAALELSLSFYFPGTK